MPFVLIDCSNRCMPVILTSIMPSCSEGQINQAGGLHQPNRVTTVASAAVYLHINPRPLCTVNNRQDTRTAIIGYLSRHDHRDCSLNVSSMKPEVFLAREAWQHEQQRHGRDLPHAVCEHKPHNFVTLQLSDRTRPLHMTQNPAGTFVQSMKQEAYFRARQPPFETHPGLLGYIYLRHLHVSPSVYLLEPLFNTTTQKDSWSP